jgi:PIN domain nuclease of toxin-antitoxin system
MGTDRSGNPAPFDRMLVAQAKSEQRSLLTRDRAMLGYANQATILRLPEA